MAGWSWGTALGAGALLWSIATLYVVLCPFTKVEESMHLQATHDVLFHGFDVQAYGTVVRSERTRRASGRRFTPTLSADHLEFPGVVPRTFLGALFLAALSWPGAVLVWFEGLPKLFVQVWVRSALAGAVCFGYARLLHAVSHRLGRSTSLGMVAVVATTPHFLFYASRTLPNTFALLLLLHACAEWVRMRGCSTGWGGISRHVWASLACLVCAVVWLRCDMLVLMGPIGLAWLAAGHVRFPALMVAGVVCGVGALAATVVVDSWFWRRLLWPEGEVLWFNGECSEEGRMGGTSLRGITTARPALLRSFALCRPPPPAAVENRSHEYGVSAWHWYFTSALPRSLLAGLALAPLGALRWAAPRVESAISKKASDDAMRPEVCMHVNEEKLRSTLTYGNHISVRVAEEHFSHAFSVRSRLVRARVCRARRRFCRALFFPPAQGASLPPPCATALPSYGWQRTGQGVGHRACTCPVSRGFSRRGH